MAPAVQPLRIQKNQTGSSPTKMPGNTARPLAEVSPMERRRNSPSFKQVAGSINAQSPSFELSPYNPSGGATSTRRYWQDRDPGSPAPYASENSFRENSPSPKKRSSIENLMRASRVKNSNMFTRQLTQEYDPTSVPHIERPLAGGRPLGAKFQSHVLAGNHADSPRTEAVAKSMTPEDASEAGDAEPIKNGLMIEPKMPISESPSKDKPAPTKSSLSNRHAVPVDAEFMALEHEVWSDDEPGSERKLPPGRVLHRHAKSVTFDSAPPQVKEYEMTTPELSSVGTGSRESSYGSATDFMDQDDDSQAESYDREDSFDPRLEDAEKTPVVEPEGWRHMSPATAPMALSQHFEDPFSDAGSPAPMAPADPAGGAQPSAARTSSNGSTGDSRPLPPVPGLQKPRSDSNSSVGLSDVAERSDNLQRSLPSPPGPASVSKADILGMSGANLTLEERLRLLMAQDDEDLPAGEIGSPASTVEHDKQEHDIPRQSIELTEPKEAALTENVSHPPQTEPRPRISRDSILRKVKSQAQLKDDLDFNFSSPVHSSTPEPMTAMALDPDVALPSTEEMSIYEDGDTSVMIKQEHEDTDLYAVPALYGGRADPYADENEENIGEESVIHHQVYNDDDESNYSRDSLGNRSETPQAESLEQPQAPAEVEPAVSPQVLAALRETTPSQQLSRMSLPEFASLLGTDDLDFGLQSFMSTTSPKSVLDQAHDDTEQGSATPQPRLERPTTPVKQIQPPAMLGDAQNEEDLKTPEPVVRYSAEPEPLPVNPTSVPDRVATVKARGGKLKARPSATPADLDSMAAARRQVSGQHPVAAEPPPIPARSPDRPSLAPEAAHETGTLTSMEDGQSEDVAKAAHKRSKSQSPRKSLVKLDVPMNALSDDLSSGLTKEFDRMMEVQKRGYLMRQNTKVIVASSNAGQGARGSVEQPVLNARGTRSAGNSPRKPSHERSQSWNVEPWNNKVRRKSIKDTAGSPRKKPVEGPVPPLPGKESNVSRGPDVVAEPQPVVDEPEAGGERGRLFVKVLGVKDLDLPLVKDQPSWFNLTLDNGIHCVQTAWIELGKNAPIGQEFELVVLDDLEFTLTLQTEPPQPPTRPTTATIESPTKSVKATKTSALSRVFASPKKRREMEKKQQQEDAQQMARKRLQEAEARRSVLQPTAWDLLHHLVARDGTFARAYVSLKEHEDSAYGRPFTLVTDCFNEWATEPAASMSSYKSKRGDVQRRAPYRIGKLEVQLLFVPKPKGAQDADMPKSLNACVRELREAEANASRKHEGHLSQQGGDCPYWRRRFFKLDGSKLTAFHETTRQPRATINLAKASKLIDDRSTLLQRDVAGKGGGRRKSAFAEEEEGYMFVEEGFRIKFANGEIIDFYADSAAEKDGWMMVLSDTVGKDLGGGKKSWTEMVLARELLERQKVAAAAGGKMGLSNGVGVGVGMGVGNGVGMGLVKARPVQQQQQQQQHARQPSTAQAAESPRKSVHEAPTRQAPGPAPPPIDKSPRHLHSSAGEAATSTSSPQQQLQQQHAQQVPRRRAPNAARSMIF